MTRSSAATGARATARCDAAVMRAGSKAIVVVTAALLVAAAAFAQSHDPSALPVVVPARNDPHLRAPPPRPPVGDAAAKARRLFDAIVKDTPNEAEDFFFPRGPFLVLKGIAAPGRYWDRLHARYNRDIHTLHTETPDLGAAAYVGFTLVRRGGFVTPREEANRLPYWASRHSFLRYRVAGHVRRMEVRVLITWDDHWYVTHLREFH